MSLRHLVFAGALAIAAPLTLHAHGCGGVAHKKKDHAEHGSEKTKDHAKMQTIVEIAAGNESFSTLVAAVTKAGLVEALSGEGPFTVFAPTDEAFAKLPEGTLESLTDEQLVGILKAHVVSGKVMAADAIKAAGTEVSSLNGTPLAVAFDKKAKSVSIAGSTVVKADIKAKNGVIHVIDTVIIPGSKEKAPNIVEIAAGNEAFSTLVSAVTKAGLVEALSGEGPLTVFAPTDDAFAKLPKGTLESLSQEQLVAILKAHVVSGKVMAADAIKADGTSVASINGTPLAVALNKEAETVSIAGSTVVKADIKASNGVIHVIDTVIIPEG